MKFKPECCEKFLRKPRACGKCPLMAGMSKKRRRKRLKKIQKKLARAA